MLRAANVTVRTRTVSETLKKMSFARRLDLATVRSLGQWDGEIAQGRGSRLDPHHAAHGPGALVPADRTVLPGRDAVDAIAAFGVGRHEVGVVEHHDDGAHVGMDVAEDLDRPRLVEAHRLGGALRVAAEVERRR